LIGKGQGVGGRRQGLGRKGLAPTRCVCPKCGYEIPHERGIPCRTHSCPNCGTPLVGIH